MWPVVVPSIRMKHMFYHRNNQIDERTVSKLVTTMIPQIQHHRHRKIQTEKSMLPVSLVRLSVVRLDIRQSINVEFHRIAGRDTSPMLMTSGVASFRLKNVLVNFN